MRAPYTPMMGMLASAFLAVLTLTVFAKSQYNGPEGVVTEYFSAIVRQDRELAEISAIGNDYDFVQVTSAIAQFFRAGCRFRVIDVVRTGNIARVGVIFVFPDRGEYPLVMTTQKVGKRWKVDVGRTARPTISPFG